MAIKTEGTTKLDQFIHVIPNVMTEDNCKRILDMISEDMWLAAGQGTNSTDPTLRNSDSFDISGRKDSKPWNEINALVFNALNTAWRTYHLMHPKFKVDVDTGYEVLRYKEGMRCLEHVDHYNRAPRSVTCSIGLNNDYKGGEFTFFGGKIQHHIPAGAALMFPSNFMYPHGVNPVTQGTRYSIITWLI